MGGNKKINFRNFGTSQKTSRGFGISQVLEETISRSKDFKRFSADTRRLLAHMKGNKEKNNLEKFEYYIENLSYIYLIVRISELLKNHRSNKSRSKRNQNINTMLELAISLSEIENVCKQSEITIYGRKMVKIGLEKLLQKKTLTEVHKMEIDNTLETLLLKVAEIKTSLIRWHNRYKDANTEDKYFSDYELKVTKHSNLVFTFLNLLRFEAKHNREVLVKNLVKTSRLPSYPIVDGMFLISKTKVDKNIREFLQRRATKNEILLYLEILEEIKDKKEEKFRKELGERGEKPSAWWQNVPLIMLKNELDHNKKIIEGIKQILN